MTWPQRDPLDQDMTGADSQVMFDDVQYVLSTILRKATTAAISHLFVKADTSDLLYINNNNNNHI